MTGYAVARLLAHLVAGLFTCALVFPLTDDAGRERRIRRWSARLLAICGVTLRIKHNGNAGELPHALIVANHVSWLDIFVLNSMQPCRFVAKSDIRGWPLIGWLCEQAGTIFIARGRQRDVRRIYEGLVSGLLAGERVAFFPEGTTAPQGTILPFHANLFEAAIEARVPVQPCALRYLDDAGRPHAAADFVGDMTLVQSIAVILRSGGMTAECMLLEPIATDGLHRRSLAADAHKTIANALGYCQPENRCE